VRPTISVLIPNWDGRVHLEDCLSALRTQTRRDFEVVMVDNGSQDGSVPFVRERFPEVRVLALNENRGFAGGNNAGIAVAQGEFIALLNNDTLADPGWLAALHRATQAQAEYGMWASRVVLFDQPELLDSAGDGLTVAGAPFKHGHLQLAIHYDQPREVFGPSGAAALYHRRVLEELDGLDEDFFLIHEDVDLAFRARLRGYRCQYVPEAVVRHKVNASLGYMSREYVFYGQRNLEYLFLKNLPFFLLLRCLPAHLCFDLLAFGHFALRGHGLTFLQAKGAALRALPAVLQKRRALQKQGRVSASSLLRLMERRWIGTKVGAAIKGWQREKLPAISN
jgi:GT2 family glycosyltransferase